MLMAANRASRPDHDSRGQRYYHRQLCAPSIHRPGSIPKGTPLYSVESKRRYFASCLPPLCTKAICGLLRKHFTRFLGSLTLPALFHGSILLYDSERPGHPGHQGQQLLYLLTVARRAGRRVEDPVRLINFRPHPTASTPTTSPNHISQPSEIRRIECTLRKLNLTLLRTIALFAFKRTSDVRFPGHVKYEHPVWHYAYFMIHLDRKRAFHMNLTGYVTTLPGLANTAAIS